MESYQLSETEIFIWDPKENKYPKDENGRPNGKGILVNNKLRKEIYGNCINGYPNGKVRIIFEDDNSEFLGLFENGKVKKDINNVFILPNKDYTRKSEFNNFTYYGRPVDGLIEVVSKKTKEIYLECFFGGYAKGMGKYSNSKKKHLAVIHVAILYK